MSRSLINITTVWTILSCLAGYPFKAQGDEAFDLNAVSNAFIYNFAKFTTWPDDVFSSQDASLNICLYGTPIDFNNVASSLEKKSIESRTIKIIVLSSENAFKDCHILYIDKTYSNKLSHKISGHILTISNSDNFYEEGGMISLVVINDRMYFKANPDIMKQSGIIMNGQLLRLALNLRKQEAD